MEKVGLLFQINMPKCRYGEQLQFKPNISRISPHPHFL